MEIMLGRRPHLQRASSEDLVLFGAPVGRVSIDWTDPSEPFQVAHKLG